MAAKPKKKLQPSLREVIRPEQNIEKWSIWQPANARTPLKARIFEREIPLPEGKMFVAKLKVGFTDEGTLTTDEQRVYYALVKLWEESGRPQGYIPLSLYRLMQILKKTCAGDEDRKKTWGDKDRIRLKRALMRLRVTPLVWERAFIDGANDTRLDVLHPFTILDDLKLATRKQQGKTVEAGYFRFHEAILKNLLASHTKPVLFDVVLSFRSEIAQILYTHLDLILADKPNYERRTKELFEDLGLEGKEYAKLSVRTRRLEPALRELQGKAVTTGKITTAKLEATKDGADRKLIVRKGKATVALPAEQSQVIPLPVPSRERQEAEELVRLFHKLFHGSEECYPSGKPLDHAAILIARHGVTKARHIVEFARREAQRTKFRPATFGAVMQYEARAIKDLDDQEQAKRRQLTHRQAQEAKEHRESAEEAAKADAFQAFLNSLTEEDRKTFETEAIERAGSYDGCEYILRRYRELLRKEPEGSSATSYRLMILRRHFEETTRQRETPTG
jgi:hypothetical protein